jgi:hypothetical protein
MPGHHDGDPHLGRVGPQVFDQRLGEPLHRELGRAVLEDEWSITVGEAFTDATEAFVAAAVLADGTPGVLKLLVPRDADVARHEITVLRLADGEGCARLFRSDAERGALLLERLGRPLSQLGLPVRHRHEILCQAAEKIWRPAPEAGLPTGADKGRWLAGSSRVCGKNSGARALSARSPARFLMRNDALPPTTTNSPCSCTVTSTSGTRCVPVTASSWSIPTACSRSPSTTSGS